MSKDQNQAGVTKKRKMAKWVKGIFRWLFITLLGLLLVGAIVFEVSWKITLLLVVFLLACTVLAKRHRKWFWFGVGGVIVILIIWVFLPDENEGWKPFTFEKELAALEPRQSIPDEENAARFYNDLLEEEKRYEELPPNEKMAELMEKGEGEISLEDINDLLEGSYSTYYPEFSNCEFDELTRNEFWSSKDYPEIAEWLGEHKSTIISLVEASKKEKCYFSDRSANICFSNDTLDRLPSIRRWAMLLLRSANNDVGDDRVDEAIEKYIAILQMAKHQYQQPQLVEHLVGWAIEELATKQLNKFIVAGKAREADLDVIEDVLVRNKRNWSSDCVRLLEYEKLIQKNTNCSLCFQINSEGKIRLSHDPTAAIRASLPEEFGPITYLQKKVVKAYVILAWFVMPSTPEEIASIVDEEYERLFAMADPNYDWQKEPEEIPITSLFSTSAGLNFRYFVKVMADMEEEVYFGIHDLYVRTIAEQRGSRIIILLRRYKNENGSWPGKLQDISLVPVEIFVDPINNGSFVYKLVDDGFMLYSKGKNNVDENGINDNYDDGTGADDWLIWPLRSCKTEGENADLE